ncbi:MAG: hypothetical protein IPK26_01445 [Planctomycetes bacterium]|nr:hypothetical protein [Planctomycetota bacterium]
MRFSTTFGALFATAAIAAAQCQFQSVTATSIGRACNVGPTGCCLVMARPTLLIPALDTGNCRLDLGVNALEGCCGVTVVARVVVLGDQQAATPFPQFGRDCMLHIAPLAVLIATPDVQLPIPSTLPPLTFLAQGAALIQAPFGMNEVMTFTDALAISLR